MKELFNKRNLIKFFVLAAICIAVPFTLGWQLEMCTIDTEYILWNTYRWNVFILCLIELIVFLCTLSLRWTLVIYVPFITIIYFANHYIFNFRGRMLTFSDITAIGTAAKVAGNYSYKPTTHMVQCLVVALLIIAIALLINLKIRKKWYLRIAGLVFAAILAFAGERVFIESDFLLKQNFIVSTGFRQSIHYDGYMVASCLHFKDSKFEKPEGYSKEACEEELRKYSEAGQASKDNRPNIIFILNESFADLAVNGNLQLDHDMFADFYANEGIKVCGYANASVVGGGTANTEFEIFTGSTMSFFPSTYYPYQQCINSPKNSIVTSLKDAGYTTFSMHPEPSSNWNRKNVYSYLGFDHSYWKTDFAEDAEVIGNGISDWETYKKIIEIYENNKDDGPLFIYDMTMQNHGGFAYLDIEPTVHITNFDFHFAEIYMTLVEESVKSFNKITEYFSNCEEPVMLVFLGDHQPKFEGDFYDLLYAQTPGLTYEEIVMNMYKTPFVIWTNYDSEEETGVDISMNYIGAKMLEYAGVNTNPYMSWVYALKDEFPLVTSNVIRDKDGNFYYRDTLPDEMNRYRQLQYMFLFDE